MTMKSQQWIHVPYRTSAAFKRSAGCALFGQHGTHVPPAESFPGTHPCCETGGGGGGVCLAESCSRTREIRQHAENRANLWPSLDAHTAASSDDRLCLHAQVSRSFYLAAAFITSTGTTEAAASTVNGNAPTNEKHPSSSRRDSSLTMQYTREGGAEGGKKSPLAKCTSPIRGLSSPGCDKEITAFVSEKKRNPAKVFVLVSTPRSTTGREDGV